MTTYILLIWQKGVGNITNRRNSGWLLNMNIISQVEQLYCNTIGPISWGSKRQWTITLSTTDTEYNAIVEAE